jgi:hypothetical protein
MDKRVLNFKHSILLKAFYIWNEQSLAHNIVRCLTNKFCQENVGSVKNVTLILGNNVRTFNSCDLNVLAIRKRLLREIQDTRDMQSVNQISKYNYYNIYEKSCSVYSQLLVVGI